MKTLMTAFTVIALLVFVLILMRVAHIDYNLAMKIVGGLITATGIGVITALNIDNKEETTCL